MISSFMANSWCLMVNSGGRVVNHGMANSGWLMEVLADGASQWLRMECVLVNSC